MEELTIKIKTQIIEQLNLEDINVADIGDDDQLFGEGLALDSIDALELIVMMEKEYGIKIEDPNEGRKIFTSVRTIAEYVHQHQTV